MTRTLLPVLTAIAIASFSMLAGCSSPTSLGSNGGSGGALVVPTTIDFGSLANGKTKDTVVSIVDESFDTVTITGSSVSSSTVQDMNFSRPVSVVPDQARDIHLEFTPSAQTNTASDTLHYYTASGSFVAVMTLEANDGRTAGGAGNLSILPAAIYFGNLPIGQWHDTTVSILNSGSAAVTLLPSTVSSYEAQDTNFSLPSTLAPGSGMTIHIEFNPAQMGTRTAADTIHYLTGGTAHTSVIALVATGISGSTSLGPGSTFTYDFSAIDTNGTHSPHSDSTFTVVSNTLTYQGKTNVLEVRDATGGLSYYHTEANGDIDAFVTFPQLGGFVLIPAQWLTIPLYSKVEQTTLLYDTSVTDPTGTTQLPVTIKVTADTKDLGPSVVNAAGQSFNCERGSLTISATVSASAFGVTIPVLSQTSTATISYSKQLGYYLERDDLYMNSSMNSSFQQHSTTSSDTYLLKSFTKR